MRVALMMLVVSSAAFAQGSFLPGMQPSRLSLGALEPETACRADVDCKGSRICQAGACTDVAGASVMSMEAPVAPPMPPPQSLNLASVHVRLIDQQIQLLEFQKLSLGGPIFLTAFGGVGVLSGLSFMAIPYGLSFALVIGGTALVVLAAGLLWLLVDIGFNRRVDEAVTRLREEKRTQFGVATATAPRVGAAMIELAAF